MSDKIVYPAVLEFADDGVIGVSFPDLPGVVTSAYSQEEALELAREAMIFHLEGMLEDGEVFPAATNFLDVKSAHKNEIVTLIDGPRPDKQERFNVSATASELMRIDALAQAHKMTRSAWMVSRSIESFLEARDDDEPVGRRKSMKVDKTLGAAILRRAAGEGIGLGREAASGQFMRITPKKKDAAKDSRPKR